MSIELSPSQERRLHSILDRGLEALHESSENISRGSPSLSKKDLMFDKYSQDSHKATPSLKEINLSPDLASEVKFLRERVSCLESKIPNPDSIFAKINKRKTESPGNSFKYISSNSSRNSSVKSRDSSVKSKSSSRNHSKDRIQSIENSEREIQKMERSITNSPSRKKNNDNSRQIEKFRLLVEKEKKKGEKLRKENEMLRKEIGKRDELKNIIAKLQEDYNEIAVSFERSENVRKKQKDLILQLKNEIRSINEKNIPDHIPSKSKKKK